MILMQPYTSMKRKTAKTKRPGKTRRKEDKETTKNKETRKDQKAPQRVIAHDQEKDGFPHPPNNSTQNPLKMEPTSMEE